jgi:hypothetical protein
MVFAGEFVSYFKVYHFRDYGVESADKTNDVLMLYFNS